MREVIGTEKNPYHLSIGVAIVDNGKIGLVQMKSGETTIPRETMDIGESLEDEFKRGALEELGLEVEMKDFLGTITTHFNNWQGVDIEKSTIYFSGVKTAELDRELPEKVIWLPLDEALCNLKKENNPESDIVQKLIDKTSQLDV
jgi:ADP-ribose pyrophosphatase YjhB (NUDIX family)